MEKKLRNLLILVGILVVLCVGYAVVGLVLPDEDSTDTPGDGENGTSSVFRVTEGGLTRLAFTYDKDGDGEAELWDYRFDEEAQAWQWVEDPDVPLGKSLFVQYAETLAAATTVKIITDVTNEQFREFGLQDPIKTVTFTDVAGGEQSFCLGAYNTYNGTYCACLNGDTSTVYLLGSELYDAFETPIEDLVSYDDLPSCKAEDLISVTFTRGDRVVTVSRLPVTSNGDGVAAETAANTAADTAAETGAETETETDGNAAVEYAWFRSVNGGELVRVADDLADSMNLLLGDMDYLTCYSVRTEDFPAYGLDADTTGMTVVYDTEVGGTVIEKTFTLTLGGTDKYNYYYANPEGTTLTMLLGGSVWYKLMTYDDEHLSVGDAVETESTETASL